MIEFDYHGTPLATFNHLYNLTHLNERCVELAVAHWWLEHLGAWERLEALEVGNVLGHYAPRFHDVVDWHEPAAWYQELAGQRVVNEDVLVVADVGRRYPAVVSISTVEHTDDPVAVLLALHKMTAPGGRLLVTFPTGAHPDLDGVVDGSVYFDWTRTCTVSRVAGGLAWATDPMPRVMPVGVTGWAHTVFIAEWEAPCES